MILNYCPACSEPLKKLTDTHYICEQGHDYWNNPRATADVAIINQEGLLLVSKRAREPFKDGYDLPGGFLEYGETAKEAAVRELKEEASITVKPENLELIATVGGAYLENETLMTAIFLLREWEGEIQPSDDSAELEWKPLEFMDSPLFAEAYDGLRPIIESKLNI